MHQSLEWIFIVIIKVDSLILGRNLYILWKSGFIYKNDGCFDYLILLPLACFSADRAGIGLYHWWRCRLCRSSWKGRRRGIGVGWGFGKNCRKCLRGLCYMIRLSIKIVDFECCFVFLAYLSRGRGGWLSCLFIFSEIRFI